MAVGFNPPDGSGFFHSGMASTPVGWSYPYRPRRLTIRRPEGVAGRVELHIPPEVAAEAVQGLG
jgi:hypothetical protein